MRPRIEIYTKRTCSYCHRAKALLDAKGVAYREIDVTGDPQAEARMRERSGRRTVPEIFVDDRLIGGCDDLMALEDQGELDALLGLTPR